MATLRIVFCSFVVASLAAGCHSGGCVLQGYEFSALVGPDASTMSNPTCGQTGRSLQLVLPVESNTASGVTYTAGTPADPNWQADVAGEDGGHSFHLEVSTDPSSGTHTATVTEPSTDGTGVCRYTGSGASVSQRCGA